MSYPLSKENLYFTAIFLSLNVNDIAAVLGISRANAYTLMRAKGFPTIFIGKRMIVPRDKFIEWMDLQISA